jgi:hypothetical protein
MSRPLEFVEILPPQVSKIETWGTQGWFEMRPLEAEWQKAKS